MKSITIAMLLVAIAPCAAFGQSASAPPAALAGMTHSTAATGQQPTAGQWALSYADTVPITRAQVYRDLIDAQKDRQIAQLDKTVYAHH